MASVPLLFPKADLIVLDDLAARLVASGLDLRVTGTLGLLSAAHRQGLFGNLSGALEDLRTTGFRIAPELMDQLLSS